MDHRVPIVFFLVRFSQAVQYHNANLSKESFGPYYAQIQSIFECNYSGPIYKSVHDSYRLEHKMISKFKEEFIWHWTADEDYKLVKGSVIGALWRNGGFQIFFNKTSEDPCSFKSFKYFINRKDMLKIKNCIIPKGNYSTSKINPNIYAHTYLASKFFYGKASLEASFYSAIGLTFCLNYEILFLPIVTGRKFKNFKSHPRA